MDKYIPHERFAHLTLKISEINKLLVKILAIADEPILHMVAQSTGSWMVFGQMRCGADEQMEYAQVNVYENELHTLKPKKTVLLSDYTHTEEDYLRGKELIRKILSMAEPCGLVHQLIAQNTPYSPKLRSHLENAHKSYSPTRTSPIYVYR